MKHFNTWETAKLQCLLASFTFSFVFCWIKFTIRWHNKNWPPGTTSSPMLVWLRVPPPLPLYALMSSQRYMNGWVSDIAKWVSVPWGKPAIRYPFSSHPSILSPLFNRSVVPEPLALTLRLMLIVCPAANANCLLSCLHCVRQCSDRQYRRIWETAAGLKTVTADKDGWLLPRVTVSKLGCQLQIKRQAVIITKSFSYCHESFPLLLPSCFMFPAHLSASIKNWI